jgi:hypothetical protein
MRRVLWSFVGPIVCGLVGYVVATALGACMLFAYGSLTGGREVGYTLGMQIRNQLSAIVVLYLVGTFLFFLVYRVVLALFRASGWPPFVGLAICIGTLGGWLLGIPDAVVAPTEFPMNADYATMSVEEIARHKQALPSLSLQTVLFWMVSGGAMGWVYWAIEQRGFARLSVKGAA